MSRKRGQSACIALIWLSSFVCASGQQAAVETETAAVKPARKPVAFSHVPFLLLKLNPTAALERDNVIQYGAEIAPPFGKLSFAFDYGKGKGSWNINKYIRENQPENTTTVYRGEIRAYFSDWFPFYAMDKKPFGRYYALEFAHKDMKRFPMTAIGQGGTSLPDYAQFEKVETHEKEYAVHVKVGRHIIIHRLLFLDIFAGIGAGRYNSVSADGEVVPILHTGFSTNRKQRQPDTKGYFLSTTAGIRLALPI